MRKQAQIKPIRVLLLDNDTDAVKDFQNALETSHVTYRILHIGRSDMALRRMAKVTADFDVIVVGDALDGMSGLQMCREIVERRIDLPIILIAENQREQMVQQLYKMGFVDEYLLKDTTRKYLEVLPLLLSEVVRRHQELVAQQQQQKLIQTLEKQFRSILARNADGVVIVDQNGTIQLINAAAKQLFGKTGKVGKPFQYPVTPGAPYEIAIDQDNGDPPIAEVRVVEIEWQSERAFLASVRDITYRKKMEQELEATNKELNRAIQELERANRKIIQQQKELIQEERLKLLLQMAGASANELNEPLIQLLGSIDLIRQTKGDPGLLFQNLDHIEKAGRQISRIIKRMQTIHPNENATPVPKELQTHPDTIHVLCVEESDSDFKQIQRHLEKNNRFDWVRASGITDAKQILSQTSIDLILSEYWFRDGNGIDLIRYLSEIEDLIPVVIITGHGDEVIASRVIQEGASEYIPKSRLDEFTLQNAIISALEKGQLAREIKEVNLKLAEMSYKDELTGVYNRRYFQQAIQNELSWAKAHHTDLVLCMVDLDHFKHVNDTYGHAAGDLVLAQVGRMLLQLSRKTDIVCRYGGEEFVVLLPQTRTNQARIMAERFRKKLLEHEFNFQIHTFHVTASIGMASFSDVPSGDPEEFIDLADQALYEAKKTGRNRIVAFSSDSMRC